MMGRRKGFFVSAGVLLGLAVSLLSPSVYRSMAIAAVEDPGGFGIPAGRHTALLRRSIRLPEQARIFEDCLRSARFDIPSESIPETLAVQLDPLDPWIDDLSQSGFKGSLEEAFAARRWALEIQFIDGLGYSMTLFTRESGVARALLGLTQQALGCWILRCNEEEPLRRQASLVSELERIEDLLAETSFVPNAKDSDRLPDLDELAKRIEAFESELGVESTTARPAVGLGVWLSRLDRLAAMAVTEPTVGELETLRDELVRAAGILARRKALEGGRTLAAERLVMSAYSRVYHTTEALPVLGEGLEIKVEELRSRAWPWSNTVLLGFLFGALLEFAWLRFGRRTEA